MWSYHFATLKSLTEFECQLTQRLSQWRKPKSADPRVDVHANSHRASLGTRRAKRIGLSVEERNGRLLCEQLRWPIVRFDFRHKLVISELCRMQADRPTGRLCDSLCVYPPNDRLPEKWPEIALAVMLPCADCRPASMRESDSEFKHRTPNAECLALIIRPSNTSIAHRNAPAIGVQHSDPEWQWRTAPGRERES